jgi:hypothetical protein
MHCRKFLNILAVELDDALEDFDALIGLYHQKHRQGHLTDYVLQQNVGFVETEKLALRDVRDLIDRMPLCKDDDLDRLRANLEEQVDEVIRAHDLPSPARDYILRKIGKVFTYVGQGELGAV